MSNTEIRTFIETRVMNQPFGKFTVQGYDTSDKKLEVTFWGVKSLPDPRWRYLDQYGHWAYPWWEHATFDTLAEAHLFAEWVNKDHLCKK